MSEWGTSLDVIEAEIRQALSDLPLGDAGFERVDGLGEDLPAGKLPHIFVRSIIEAADESPDNFGAEDVTVLYTLALWTYNETQEEIADRLDLIRTEIDGNRTLGGIVDRSRVVARGIEEQSDRSTRRAEFIVQTEVSR